MAKKTNNTTPLTVAIVGKPINRKVLKKKLADAGYENVTITDCHRKEGVDIILHADDEKELKVKFANIGDFLEKEQLNFKPPRIFSSTPPVVIVDDVHNPAPPADTEAQDSETNQPPIPSTDQPSTQD